MAAVVTLVLVFPEIVLSYLAEHQRAAGRKFDALRYHKISAIIRIARGVRLLEIFTVSENISLYVLIQWLMRHAGYSAKTKPE